MIKLINNIDRNELRNKISKDQFLYDVLDAVDSGMARVLASDTATGVIKIFVDSKNKMELFISSFQGSKGREYMKDLIDFAKFNKINFIGFQTKRRGLAKVVIERFKFNLLNVENGFFILRKEVF